LNLSLLEVETRKSHPLITEQLVREEVRESAPKAVKEKRTKRGRPKGNTVDLRKTPSFRHEPPEPRLQGWHGSVASLQSGFRQSMPE